MSGPPYPPPPAPGSNAIGEFTIGVSPLGDITPFNFWQTVISQYANSVSLTSIIESFDAAMDQTENFDNLFDDIWNIDTATGYGLDVWGRIVNVSRTLQLFNVGGIFGFEEAEPGVQSFGFGTFYQGQSLTNNYVLADEPYRLLIRAKAAANISNCSIPAINQILLDLFPGRGNCYVTDGPSSILPLFFGFMEGDGSPFGQGTFYASQPLGVMVMEYIFNFPLTEVEQSIVTNSGALPVPTGVSVSVNVL